jgi:hypothetical protein
MWCTASCRVQGIMLRHSIIPFMKYAGGSGSRPKFAVPLEPLEILTPKPTLIHPSNHQPWPAIYPALC